MDRPPLGTKAAVDLRWRCIFFSFRHFCLLWLPRELVYEPMLDQAGHAAGPESELVNASMLYPRLSSH